MLRGALTALVWLLPGWLRRSWGVDLLATAQARLRTAGRRGHGVLLAAFIREAGSLLKVAAVARTYHPEFPQGRGVMFEQDSNRPLRTAWVVALVVHFLAFTAVVPFGPGGVEAEPERTLTVIRVYNPPQPPVIEPERRTVKKPARPVPIPDPTPNEPEPIVAESYEYTSPEPERPDVEFAVVEPAGPPAPQQQTYRVGADVRQPELLQRVLPDYPELARRARLECVVIVEARIDRDGNVDQARPLRDCGLGMTEAALAAVRQWKYAPTQIDGRPVAVMLTATVTFRLR
jgi:protein TonB